MLFLTAPSRTIMKNIILKNINLEICLQILGDVFAKATYIFNVEKCKCCKNQRKADAMESLLRK